MTFLTDQAWLSAPATRAVMNALDAAGGAGCARFVGGCVRNALIGRPIEDIDIATVLEPEETYRAILAAGLKAVPTGLTHGTVTAIADRTPFEITTLRRDVSTDGRRATVAFTADWSEDAARRDFRLNALYADLGRRVFDPTSRGVEDALAGRIVFVGDPETRIREDYLRILRFFRFFAWYGREAIDRPGLEACRALAPGMQRLSAERVGSELFKLLRAPDPTPALREMAGAGILAQVLPEARLTPAFAILAEKTQDPALRLMALLSHDYGTMESVASRLRLSNAIKVRLQSAATTAGVVHLTMTDREARAALYRHGAEAVTDAVLMAWSESPANEHDANRLTGLAARWNTPRLPVGGKDVARLGVPPGPEIGRVLRAFEAGWIADDFPSTGHADRLAALAGQQR